MRRHPLLVIGALAFAGAAVASGAQAQVDPEPTTPPPSSTTTSPPVPPPDPERTTTTATAPTPPPRPTTTIRGATTTTTAARGPVPPPPSGVSQPLDPSLLGGLPMVDLNPTTTTVLFSTESDFPSTTIFTNDSNAITVSQSGSGPSGGTLALASVAWLASLGGLLFYAEEQRSKQWRHLAR